MAALSVYLSQRWVDDLWLFDCAARGGRVPGGHYAAWVLDGLCSDTTNCIEVLLDGVNELTIDHSPFTIFPNPADESITVQLSQSCTNCLIKITNTLGQVIQSSEFKVQSNSTQLNIHTLPSGIYFITILSDKMSVMKKFVKQ